MFMLVLGWGLRFADMVVLPSFSFSFALFFGGEISDMLYS